MASEPLETKKDDGETPSLRPSPTVSRHATFANIQSPVRRDNYFTPPDRPMLSRRASLSSASRQAEGFFSRHFRRRTPVDRAIPTVEDDEGAPIPRDTKVSVDGKKIFESLLPGGGPAADGRASSNRLVFPEYDSLNAYFVLDETAKELWSSEVNRLVDVVTHPDRPLRFPNQNFFKEGSEKGYRDLSRLSERILTAMTLCLLDNECINVEFCKKLSSRGKLSKFIVQLKTSQNYGEPQEAAIDPTRENEQDGSLDAIFCLIDYISAVLARLITGTATGHYWLVNTLGVLIKRITKMKVLLLDMPAHIPIAVSAGEAALENSDGLDESTLEDEEDCEEALRIINANTKEGLTSVDEAEVESYCAHQNKFRIGINATIRYILLSLRFLDRSGLSATEYEICALVYETGFEGFEAFLFQDRDLEYSATSDRDTLNTAYSAFAILNQTVANVQTSHRPHFDCSLSTTIEWTYVNCSTSCARKDGTTVGLLDLSGNSRQTCRLKSLEDIISVMVPLVVSSPVLVANFTAYRTMMALTCDVKDSVRRFADSHFSAFFRMYTGDFDKNSRGRDVLRLSDAVDSGFFSRCSLMSEPNFGGGSGGEPQVTDLDSRLSRKLNGITWEMETWVVDENSVTVQHRLYVWGVIAAAVVLAGGGLAMGFTVGESIKGVDPFNLATYTWVLAAFIILICKSIQVDHWTWSDFLHRRVRCRSVSELQAVTGISDQLIIAKLLHDECGGSVLKTRGPFNSVFLNRHNDGFSIDRLISTCTMLLSGLTLLKVVTPRGAALVCLDARRGTDLKVVEHQGIDSSEHLICEELGKLSLHEREPAGGSWASTWRQRPVRLQLTRSKDLKWRRVLGVYNEKYATFM